jgi:hypothetical protein
VREFDAQKTHRDAMSVASGTVYVASGTMSVASGGFGGASLGLPRSIDFQVHHRSPSIINAPILWRASARRPWP